VNQDVAVEMLSDVTKTFTAATEFKKQLEKDLENRAELLTLINQLKHKQEVIIASNIGKLQDCLKFMENIKAAQRDLEDITRNISGAKRYSEFGDDRSPKRAKVNSPPPPLPGPSQSLMPPQHSHMNFPYPSGYYANPISQPPPPM